MLTYDVLRSFLDQEKAATGLVRLPDDFFDQVAAYFRGKADLQRDADAAKRLLLDLLEVRERKLLTAAVFAVRSGVEPDVLPEEKAFLSALREAVQTFGDKKKFLLAGGQVEVLQPVPAFLGTDLKTYGPLEPGQVVALPPQVASLLVEKGAAKPAGA
ncbi:MAG: DNA replication complex GINS family protein [Candidatus Aenigmarchaeota archaeon]|nr:DNA replication complex GINS family protein [Candidatus Aenigmarchaeota archaeon]